MRDGSRRVASILGVCSLVAVVTVGVSWVGGTRETAPNGPDVAGQPLPATPEQVRRAAAEVYGSFSGSESQRNAGFVMRAYVFNHALDDCLASAGYSDWDWSLSRQYATPVDPLASGVWFSEPDRPFRSEQLIAQRSRLLAERIMNRDDVPADRQAAIVGCVNTTRGGSESEAEAATEPPVAAKLREDWNEAIAQVADTVAQSSEYYECMDSARIPILVSTGLSATELGQAVSAMSPDDADIPVSASAPSAENDGWQRFIRAEKAITDADWACRKDVYAAHIMDLAPVIAGFSTNHAAEIAQAQAGWQGIQKQADAVGFTGQDGPLGG